MEKVGIIIAIAGGIGIATFGVFEFIKDMYRCAKMRDFSGMIAGTSVFSILIGCLLYIISKIVSG